MDYENFKNMPREDLIIELQCWRNKFEHRVLDYKDNLERQKKEFQRDFQERYWSAKFDEVLDAAEEAENTDYRYRYYDTMRSLTNNPVYLIAASMPYGFFYKYKKYIEAKDDLEKFFNKRKEKLNADN